MQQWFEDEQLLLQRKMMMECLFCARGECRTGEGVVGSRLDSGYDSGNEGGGGGGGAVAAPLVREKMRLVMVRGTQRRVRAWMLTIASQRWCGGTAEGCLSGCGAIKAYLRRANAAAWR